MSLRPDTEECYNLLRSPGSRRSVREKTEKYYEGLADMLRCASTSPRVSERLLDNRSDASRNFATANNMAWRCQMFVILFCSRTSLVMLSSIWPLTKPSLNM